MNVSALAPAEIGFWWIVLEAAVVVILCVIVLLTLLQAFVHDIGRHVAAVETEIRGASEHISRVPLLSQAADHIGELGGELERHVALLTRQGVNP